MKKRKSNVVYKFLAAIVVLLVGGGFLFPLSTQAADTNCASDRSSNGNDGVRICNPSDIALETKIYINGTETNFVKVGNDAGSKIDFTVKVFLKAPADIKMLTDKLYIVGATNNNLLIDGFGSTLTPKDTVKYCGSTDLGTGFSKANYPKCQSDGVVGNSDGKYDDFRKWSKAETVPAGEVYSKDFSISQSDFARLGIKNLKTSSSEGLNEFLAYPDLHIAGSGTFNMDLNVSITSQWITSMTGGKSVYVQLFSTSAEAKTDTASPTVCSGQPTSGTSTPTCVPAYGSNTSSLTNGKESGNGIVGFLVEIVTAIVFGIQWLVYQVFTHLISPLLVGVLSIRTYTDSFAAVIYPGWEVVRNLCNILFIVALIAIGLGTLFRLESYQYKHMLAEVIIAALLVNFSLLMAQAVLGLADTVQNQFLPNNSDVVNQLAYTLFVNAKVAFSAASFEQNGYFSNLAQPLFQLGFTMGSFVIFTFLAGLLVVRIVGLWVLLMISPVAYAAGALPSTAHYRGEWWKEFIKYAFFTPILAFFLNIAALLAQRMYDPQYSTLNQLTKNSSAFGGSTGSFVVSLTSNIMLIIFIIAGTKIADQFGVMGGDIMSKWAKGGALAPFGAIQWLGGRGLGRLGRWYNEKTAHLVEQHGDHEVPWSKKVLFAAANPFAFAKGWQERSHELEHHAQEEAGAAGRMVAEQYLTNTKGLAGMATLGFYGKPQLTIPYNQFTARKHENDYLKDYENMKKETLMSAAVAAEKMGGAEGTMRRRAIVKAAAKNGYMDDLLRMKHFAGQYADADGTFYSAEVLNRFMFGYLADEHGHIGEQAMRFMAEDMEELGKSTGHYEYLGHSYYDPNSKAFKRGMESVGDAQGVDGKVIKGGQLKNTWQAGFAIGELKKVSGRMRAQIAPHNLVTLRAELDKPGGGFKENGEVLDSSVVKGRQNGKLDEYQRSAIAQFDAATLQQASFAQSRLKDWALSSYVDKNSGEVVVQSDEDISKIEALWDANPLLMKHMYGQIIGLSQQEAGYLSGIRVVKLDGAGKKQVYRFGKPQAVTMPVQAEIVNEIAKDPSIKLSEAETKEFRSVGGPLVGEVYRGGMSRNRLYSQLSASTVLAGKANNIANEIMGQIQTKYKESHEPMIVVDRLDAKYHLTPLDQSEISTAVTKAVEDAVTSVPPSRALDRSDFETKITVALDSLKAANPDNKKINSLTAADYKLFIDNAWRSDP